MAVNPNCSCGSAMPGHTHTVSPTITFPSAPEGDRVIRATYTFKREQDHFENFMVGLVILLLASLVGFLGFWAFHALTKTIKVLGSIGGSGLFVYGVGYIYTNRQELFWKFKEGVKEELQTRKAEYKDPKQLEYPFEIPTTQDHNDPVYIYYRLWQLEQKYYWNTLSFCKAVSEKKSIKMDNLDYVEWIGLVKALGDTF